MAKKFGAGRFVIVEVLPGNKVLVVEQTTGKSTIIDMNRAIPYLDSRRNLYIRTDDESLKEFKVLMLPSSCRKKSWKEAIEKAKRVGAVSPTVDESMPIRKTRETMPSHEDLQNALLDLGKIEGYEVAKEYRIDGERLDVAWRMRTREIPDIVFEIHRAGDIKNALAKLKDAHDKWRCIVVLVTSEEHIQEAGRLLKGTFHEIENYSRIVLWKDVMEWLKASRTRDQIRKKLGIIL